MLITIYRKSSRPDILICKSRPLAHMMFESLPAQQISDFGKMRARWGVGCELRWPCGTSDTLCPSSEFQIRHFLFFFFNYHSQTVHDIVFSLLQSVLELCCENKHVKPCMRIHWIVCYQLLKVFSSLGQPIKSNLGLSPLSRERDKQTVGENTSGKQTGME